MNVVALTPEAREPVTDKVTAKFWAVGGGKGGIGKSIVSLNIAYWLAKLGHNVVLVDADLGGANLHTLLGMRFVHHTLADYLNKKVETLDEVAIETPVPGLRLICGASDIVGLANPKYAQKVKLMRALDQLEADHLILDLGAGADYNTLDFFLYCTYKIAVVTPQPTALQNCYGFIKSALYRAINRSFDRNLRLAPLIKRATDQNGDDPITSMEELLAAFSFVDEGYGQRLQEIINSFNLYLITNMVKSVKDRKASQIIQTVTQKYLNLKHVSLLGTIPHDPQIEDCVGRMNPAFMTNTKSQSALEFYQLVNSIIKEGGKESPKQAPNSSSLTG
ncbi:MAG: P-loop NTPase [Deltaproteobacteria bacterium]|nr:P-loop NTPase [Candidatus Anaeroferrophillus wilburensis]MBN2888472.1 P-loop NTPase [Deltaproteobacteria bacterium]